MRRTILPLLIVLFLSSCNETTQKDSNTPLLVPSDRNNVDSKSNLLNFNYTYPDNILQSRDEENRKEFFPIGFSPEGNFAYINRPCNGGCGCCTHDIIIQDLLTDKIETQLSLIPTSEIGSQSHMDSWTTNFSKIERALKLKGISQSAMQLENETEFNDSYNRHSYQIKVNKRVKENIEYPEEGDEMSYSVDVTIDKRKTKRITYGKINSAYDLEYMGFIRSPFSDLVTIILNKKQRGFEAEITNDLVAVGCHLDPNFY